ncbi:hypothetical protein KUG12_18145 [Streptomyces sp. BV333]|uniref:hypothetical protein n=1 Tax=Streptomyces sp. BV333 TaxID=2849673 RepID=UPI001C2E8C27|nr:hypothetical protein [Streptomyces sp. BV333]MBV1956246.1 hypothetical protein [Streptomyces sp. BV333]
MTQKTPAELRADAEKRLAPLGRKRMALLADLEQLDATLRPEIVQARSVELPIRRISELTTVSPNTIRAWASGAASG